LSYSTLGRERADREKVTGHGKELKGRNGKKVILREDRLSKNGDGQTTALSKKKDRVS